MDVNTELQYLSNEVREEQISLAYDRMWEDMYGAHPLWDGDWNDAMMEWERKWYHKLTRMYVSVGKVIHAR